MAKKKKTTKKSRKVAAPPPMPLHRRNKMQESNRFTGGGPKELREILEKGVILIGGEGTVDTSDKDPVFVGIVFDVNGYGPHTGAIAVEQNRFHAHEDSALQTAHEILEEWTREHYPPSKEDEEHLTETFDGRTWTMSPSEFVEAIRGTKAEKFIDTDDGELEESRRIRESRPLNPYRRDLRWDKDGYATGKRGTYHLRKTSNGWTVTLNGQITLGEWAQPEIAKDFIDRYDRQSGFSTSGHTPRPVDESRRVADFSTLHDLIQHAHHEGATHVSGSEANTRLYYPRSGQYPYEEATVWRKAGYWHAQGPHARTGVKALPRDARPIAGQRKAAETRESHSIRRDKIQSALAIVHHNGRSPESVRNAILNTGLNDAETDILLRSIHVSRSELGPLRSQVPHRASESRVRLDPFTRQYMETALWSTNDQSDESGGEPLDRNYSISDIADETREKMIADCADFQEKYADLLSQSGIDDEQAGHWFWLSRNGHGSGFFDGEYEGKKRGIGHVFTELQKAAKSYGEFDLYVGDDGKIYGS